MITMRKFRVLSAEDYDKKLLNCWQPVQRIVMDIDNFKFNGQVVNDSILGNMTYIDRDTAERMVELLYNLEIKK